LIFRQPSYKRLKAWAEFRNYLETASDPHEAVAQLYSQTPRVKVYSDPYDQTTWPSPWELIEENEYCPINQLLGVAYSLGLTERFKDWQPKITIELDKKDKCVYYLLYHDDKVYGFEDDRWIPAKNLPKSLTTKKIYTLDSLY
jgi:hypothetical protein